MELEEILASMITDEGLSVALVVGRDGVLVEGQSRGRGIDLQSVGALAVRSLVDLDRMEEALAAGTVDRLRLRFSAYELLIEMLTETDILVAGVSSASDGERLLNAAARYRGQLKQLLGDL